MTEMTIRRAEDSDAQAVAELSRQLGYPATREEIGARIRRLQALEDHAVLVAVRGGAVIGWVHVQARRSLELADYGEITGMVVDERSRSGGVGAQLVAATEAWVVTRGLTALRVRSNVVRERAHAFYERLGFSLRKSQKVFTKELKAP
jgi:N-acetylglutamate synthase-like GNAT family acetyltransferase